MSLGHSSPCCPRALHTGISEREGRKDASLLAQYAKVAVLLQAARAAQIGCQAARTTAEGYQMLVDPDEAAAVCGPEAGEVLAVMERAARKVADLEAK